jgi:hypothetical protein
VDRSSIGVGISNGAVSEGIGHAQSPTHKSTTRLPIRYGHLFGGSLRNQPFQFLHDRFENPIDSQAFWR